MKNLKMSIMYDNYVTRVSQKNLWLERKQKRTFPDFLQNFVLKMFEKLTGKHLHHESIACLSYMSTKKEHEVS